MNLPGRVLAFAERHGLWAPRPAGRRGGVWRRRLHRLAAVAARAGGRGKRRLARRRPSASSHPLATSPTDAGFVRDLADRLRSACRIGPRRRSRTGTASGAVFGGRRPRSAARVLRASRQGPSPAPVVALAHTRSDQAETVLLRLARGAGPRGLAGMVPRQGHRVRPLLDVSREELRDWLRDRGETWRRT